MTIIKLQLPTAHPASSSYHAWPPCMTKAMLLSASSSPSCSPASSSPVTITPDRLQHATSYCTKGSFLMQLPTSIMVDSCCSTPTPATTSPCTPASLQLPPISFPTHPTLPWTHQAASAVDILNHAPPAGYLVETSQYLAIKAMQKGKFKDFFLVGHCPSKKKKKWRVVFFWRGWLFLLGFDRENL